MDSDQDLKMAIGWNRLNLRMVGLWPEPTAAKKQSLNYRALIASLWPLVFISGPQSANLFLLNGDLEQITQSLCLANIPVINGSVKVFVTWYRQQDLKPLIKSFYDDWYRSKTDEERTTMINSAKVAKNISTWCTMLTQIMVTTYLSLRTIAIIKCDRSVDKQESLLLYPGYIPYDIRSTLMLVLTNVGQAFAAYCVTVPYTSVDTFVAMLVLHTCGQFENLRRRLEGLMDEKTWTRNQDQIQKELTSIVKRHEHLNWVAARIEGCFNQLLLFQLVLCTIEICFQGFLFFNAIIQTDVKLLSVQMVFFFLYVSFSVVHIYVYCYVGEALLIQSGGMGISAYKSNWFNVSPPEARYLLFIMCTSTRPLCLTAGKFGTFSMEMFSAILRTALGYLSVLLTVTGTNE